MMQTLVAFYTEDPLAAWLLTIALVLVVAALGLFRRWRGHEERKVGHALHIVGAPPAINYPPAKGPKGFRQHGNRRSPKGA